MRRAAVVAVAIGLFGTIVGVARADVTAEEVRQAIQRGVQYLESQQRADGSWSEFLPQEHGGITALCTLAMLNAGVEPGDPRIQRALGYLRKLGPEKTYVVALQTMIFARAEPERDQALLRRNVHWLEETQLRGDDWYRGAWTYPGLKDAPGGDNSNAQFALLALHEAERAGVAVSGQTWRLAQRYWQRCQNEDGSWGYDRSNAIGTGSMTCAGVTSMVIALDRAETSGVRVVGDHIDCCAPSNAAGDDDIARIERGLQWLGRRFSVANNPGSGGNLLYYLYGLERAGRLTARRFLDIPVRPGEIRRADWYREGAAFLVQNQDSLSGFWTGDGTGERQPVIGTSFALLFLSKGRWPVLLGKVQYGKGGDWNRCRADVANLTRYVETAWHRDLTWQVVNLRLADVEDLAQTPVLYLAGNQSPLPTDSAERKTLAQKLRDYLDRGGFLLAEGGCCGGDFDAGFRALMDEVFPEPEYRLRLLEPEHPVWYAEQKVDPAQLRPLWGVEFGCRTSVVYAPADPPANPRPPLSCLWELSRPGREKKYSPVVQAQIDAALSLGTNVLAYATNRELKTKEDFFRGAPHGPMDRVERGRLNVATLRHPGGCNTAPRAIANLMDAAASEMKLRTHVHDVPLDIADDAIFDYHLVFMHGRTAFRLTDAERRRLKQYLERGGMLMADAICGSKAFGESFRREMATIFPDHKLERIAADDPLLGTAYGGFDLRNTTRREPVAASQDQGPRTAVRRGPPELLGVRLGDRWAVVFSPYDISCALERHDSPGCSGYVRQDAARIGLNVVLYSLQQ